MAGRFALDGRVALVTGGSRGIGQAIALALAEQGARVAVCSRHLQACEAVVQAIEAGGGEAMALAANAGRPEDALSSVNGVVDRYGRLDILVNNAATNPHFGQLVDADDVVVEKIFEVNVHGPRRFTAAAVSAWMGAHGGSVINVASVAGMRPEPLMGVYSASKAALLSITRTLARELGGRGIRVNAVAPGLVETDFARVLVETPEIHDHIVAKTALHRHAQPDEIAGAAVYLASDAAAYVTGSVLVVDGGWTA